MSNYRRRRYLTKKRPPPPVYGRGLLDHYGPYQSPVTAGAILKAGLRAEFASVYSARVKAKRHCPYCRMKRPPYRSNAWWTGHQWDCLQSRLRGPHVFDYFLDAPVPVRWGTTGGNTLAKGDDAHGGSG